jgi:biotin/lipoyl-binding protein
MYFDRRLGDIKAELEQLAVFAHGGCLARHDRTAKGRWPFWLAALRLASGTVRVCRLHNHSVVLGFTYHAECSVTVAEIAPKGRKRAHDLKDSRPSNPLPNSPVRRRFRIAPFVITLVTVGLAVMLGRAMWDTYMGLPWTRDGTVRTYVVTTAPEVAGRVVELHVVDNQFVHKGDLLMVIDPTSYRIAVSLAEATVKQTEANAQNAEAQSERRRKLTTLSTSLEEKQTFNANALATNAQTQQAQASLDQARATSSALRSALRSTAM